MKIPQIKTADRQFHDGNLETGEPGTIVTAKWLNDVQQAFKDVSIEKVNKSGDTMTGDLSIDKTSGYPAIRLQLNGESKAFFGCQSNTLYPQMYDYNSGKSLCLTPDYARFNYGVRVDGDLLLGNNQIKFNNNVSIGCENDKFYIREPEDGNKEWFRIDDDGGAYLYGQKVVTNDMFPASKAANGWIKLPNGMIIQWGRHNFPDDRASTASFPIPFPHQALSVTTSQGNTNGKHNGYLSSLTKTGFTMSDCDGWTFWIAIGY